MQGKKIHKIKFTYLLSRQINITNLTSFKREIRDDVKFNQFINPYENAENYLNDMIPIISEKIGKIIAEKGTQTTLNDIQNQIRTDGSWNYNNIGTTKQKREFVNELEITIFNSNAKKALALANMKARLICDILSYKSKKAIQPQQSGQLVTYKDGTTSVIGLKSFRIVGETKIKLSKKDILKVKQNTPDDDFRHYFNGLLAMHEYKDARTAIREFYQIIEDNSTRPEMFKLLKYKHLRDVLSHGNKIYSSTINKIQLDFGLHYFDFTPSGKFDYNSVKNLRRLHLHSRTLEKKLNYILKKIK